MALDVQRVRAEFPALALTHDGQPRIYFDNPAGTQVPERSEEHTSELQSH